MKPEPVGRGMTRAARIVYDDRKRFLAEVGFGGYRSYLRSRLWKSIRQRVLEERPSCEYCGAKAVQVHHSSYWPAVLRGEALHCLHPVCARCHVFGEFSSAGVKQSPREATTRAGGRVETERRRAEKAALDAAARAVPRFYAGWVARALWNRLPWEKKASITAARLGRLDEFRAISRLRAPRRKRKAMFMAAFPGFDLYRSAGTFRGPVERQPE